MDNLDAVLKAHGSSLDHTVKFNLYVSLDSVESCLYQLSLPAVLPPPLYPLRYHHLHPLTPRPLNPRVCSQGAFSSHNRTIPSGRITDSADHILQRLRRHQRRLHTSYPHSPTRPELYRGCKPP
jgi:hypothetical protein